jgi:nucleoside-diphosphate-sugar epimerase
MILVTGGTGLVGSHLLYDLLQKGLAVRALKRAGSPIHTVLRTFSFYCSNPEELCSRIEWVEGDICDMASVEDALEGVDTVYHAAAVVSFNPRDRKQMLMVNVEGTANVVNACLLKNIAKLCHVSSIATLGRNSTRNRVDEETHWKTSPENSWYAISKYGAEREVWRGAEEGLNVVVVNPSLIIGPGDWSKGSIVVFRLASKGLKFYTSGKTGYVDVRDVSKAMIALMESDLKGERYILNGDNLPFRRFFDLMHAEFGKPPASIRVGPFLAGLGWRAEKIRSILTGTEPVITRETSNAANYSYEFSSAKIQQALGFKFTPIGQSVKDICGFFKNQTKSA